MPMPVFKPEQHAGRTIARPHVVGSDGIMTKLASSSVMHPPSVGVEHYREPLEALSAQEALAITNMRAMKTSELRYRLHRFALLVLENDKRTLTRG